MQANNLIAHTIPLQGKHLIEASAGTGKTFNITRIYLRLLLEKNLTVDQILVMTFTKDATEELRGRIDSFIRQALNEWDTLTVEDDYFIAIAQQVDAAQAKVRLKQALLYLDEASIFTIHGFCKRVLSQHAFTSGQPFNLAMESDCNDVILESVQDWYRILAQQSATSFLLVSEFWPTPTVFVNQFAKAIGRSNTLSNTLDLVDEISVIQHFAALVAEAVTSLENNHTALVSYLVDVKKGNDREIRLQELTQLIHWLSVLGEALQKDLHTDLTTVLTLAAGKMPDAFIDGKRYSRSVHKPELLTIFEPIKQVKAQCKMLAKQVNRAKALSVVREGIYAIRKTVDDKKTKRDLVSFDDLITRLAEQLTVSQLTVSQSATPELIPELAPELAPELTPELTAKQLPAHMGEQTNALAKLLFKQFPVALVDEFQDTDPQQFAILQAIYYHQASAALYMIGDPKQAIYGFRGGDVFAYLAARSGCDYQWLMDTNWRSSESMIQGYNRLFYGNNLTLNATDVFKYNIDYIPVKPSPKAKEKQLNDKAFAALQFIHFTPEKSRGVVSQTFRPTMAMWCANEIIRLLTTKTENTNTATSDTIEATAHVKVAVKPQDIAILVRDGAEAAVMKQALDDAGLASVFMSNRSNLLKSAQTAQLLQVLKGILYVENDQYFSAALTSDLLGFTVNKFYALQQNEAAWQSHKFAFMALKQEWENKGFIGMALKLMHEHFTAFTQDKDRILTNLLHLFELLQSASQRHKQPQELLYWFEQQTLQDNPDVEAELRLESDDDLIRIITQHGAKGLEYPVVFVPFATRYKDPLKFGTRAVTFIEYHNEHGELALSLDGSAEAKQAMADEAYAEAVRLLYVAVTRAEKRCYLLTVEFDKCEKSPLGQALHWEKETDIEQSIQQLVNDNPNDIALVTVDIDNLTAETADSQLMPMADTNNTVHTAEAFIGKIERDWWLSSFSALSRNLKHKGVSTPDRDNDIDTQHDGALSNVLTQTGLSTDTDMGAAPVVANQLRFVMEKGPRTGNLLHNILEVLPFDILPSEAEKWAQAFENPLNYFSSSSGEFTVGYTSDDLQHWFEQILKAPLNAHLNTDKTEHFALQNITPAQCVKESEFYFPMNANSASELTQLLAEHRKVNNRGELSLIRTFTAEVQLPHYHKLKGMMHGFIDLIFEQNGQYFVCDYKSTFLGEDFTLYNQETMRADIEHHHYDLQYLLYSLALHRYLTLTLPDYDPNIHFGGIYYLYLRGLTNDSAYQGAGVYYRSIQIEELEALDAIFAGGKDD